MAAPKGNKFAVGNKGGRPLTFKSPEEMQEMIDAYFDDGCEKMVKYTVTGTRYEVPTPTICGLALFLGFSSRQSLLDYQNRDEYFDTIKIAKTKIEMMYEQKLHENNCTGAIFALKNLGWSDKQEIDHNVNIPTLPNVIIKTNE